jgi:xanthine dehydrogenase YagS FAD-binding subunit
MTTAFPTKVKEIPDAGTIRAGGTDLTDRRVRGVHTGDLVDLRDMEGMDTLEVRGGMLRIGALVTLAAIAEHEGVRAGWPALAQAVESIGTPQIRARATAGGALLQEVRCWYYRSSMFHCLKKGGPACFARDGDHRFLSAVDLGPCIAPHPSTLATALLAYDARCEIALPASPSGKASGDGRLRDVPTVLGDGSDPRQTHALARGEVLTLITIAAAPRAEKSVYVRTTHRAHAEWPLVECVARVTRDTKGAFTSVVLVAGGVANRPLRLEKHAKALIGKKPDDPQVDEVFAPLGRAAQKLPQTAYKAALIPATLREALDRVSV